MALRVLRAAAPLPVIIVCDDDEVTAWALLNGAKVTRQEKPGLNAAVKSGFTAARDAGYKWSIIAHSDLPLASSFNHLLNGLGESDPISDRTAVIVGDQDCDGTNVLVLSTNCDFEFQYGPASFAAHCAEAAKRGLNLQILTDSALSIDIDMPSDLIHLPPNWRD